MAIVLINLTQKNPATYFRIFSTPICRAVVFLG